MLRKSLLLLLLGLGGLTGCVTGNSDRKSQWVVLDDAQSLRCALWPKRDRDLHLSEIVYAPQSESFLALGTNRDGSRFSYAVTFKDDYDVDVDDVANFSVGRGAVVAGLSGKGAQSRFIVFEEKQGKTHVEFRSRANNVIESSFVLNARGLKPVSVYPTKTGLWFVLKGEDQNLQFVFVDLGKGKSLKPVSAARRFFNNPKVAVMKDGTLILIGVVDQQRSAFEMTRIQTSGEVDGPRELALKAGSQIESHAVGVLGSDIFISFVDGDSLVGESQLKVARLSLDGSLRWTRAEALRNMHVSEPLFLSTEKGLELLVLKWVDEESTIARYMVTSTGFSKPKYDGVFRRGSRIMEAFQSSGGRTYTLTRSKGQSSWDFLLCRH